MANAHEPCFIYTGQSWSDIPLNVSHVKVDLAVKEIGEEAFMGRHQLRSVELHEGLESIGRGAFEYCTSLASIVRSTSFGAIHTRNSRPVRTGAISYPAYF